MDKRGSRCWPVYMLRRHPTRLARFSRLYKHLESMLERLNGNSVSTLTSSNMHIANQPSFTLRGLVARTQTYTVSQFHHCTCP
jgi:hypothetical protein